MKTALFHRPPVLRRRRRKIVHGALITVGGRFGGASNCGFSTYEQCLTTVSGIGGWCQPNTMYVPPTGRARRSHAYPVLSQQPL